LSCKVAPTHLRLSAIALRPLPRLRSSAAAVVIVSLWIARLPSLPSCDSSASFASVAENAGHGSASHDVCDCDCHLWPRAAEQVVLRISTLPIPATFATPLGQVARVDGWLLICTENGPYPGQFSVQINNNDAPRRQHLAFWPVHRPVGVHRPLLILSYGDGVPEVCA